jgi:hypothetical protein
MEVTPTSQAHSFESASSILCWLHTALQRSLANIETVLVLYYRSSEDSFNSWREER